MTLPGFPDAMPLESLAGGILIGLAAAMMLLGAGRIAGVSGIAARAFSISDKGMPKGGARSFIIGLPLGAGIAALLAGGVETEFAGLAPILAAGLLVGAGTRLGSGCTSGHGVCGVSRLSQRSIIATISFMVAGMLTVALSNVLGVPLP